VPISAYASSAILREGIDLAEKDPAVWTGGSGPGGVVVAQRGQHDEGDLAERQLAPPEADLLQAGAQQVGDEGERLARWRQRALIDKRGALGGLA
jgi:hypothetical protein